MCRLSLARKSPASFNRKLTGIAQGGVLSVLLSAQIAIFASVQASMFFSDRFNTNAGEINRQNRKIL